MLVITQSILLGTTHRKLILHEEKSSFAAEKARQY